MERPLRIGTRGSKLALWQANWVRDRLTEAHPGTDITLTVIKTKGDKILDVPLAQVGGKGLFVKEIEEALLDGTVDLAVHSMKDMPADIPDGLIIGPIPQREVPFDVLISASGAALKDLSNGAVIGTSSLRRGAQLRHSRPDVRILPLRGNLDTRLRKLDAGEMDAIVLAAAGVRRLGLAARISETLAPAVMLPAVAQGALCIEVRRDDPDTAAALAFLDHPESTIAVTGERAFLHRLGGSCQVPVAGHATIENDIIIMAGLVAELDGSRIIRAARRGPARRCREIGIELAESLLNDGADDILNRLTPTAGH
ncbi:MAG: hydroxymethylbilane synthase [Pseudomonadota bacterium]